MTKRTFDGDERSLLCDLLLELGPEAATVPEGWLTRDLAAHLYMREHDLVAGLGVVIPGAWARYGERHRRELAATSYDDLVAGIRSGPTGLFRLPWLRRVPNLNEYFVHHEDVRRANGGAPRRLTQDMDDALWSNAVGGGRLLTRRVRGASVELHDTTRGRRAVIHKGAHPVVISGTPGELLLYLFGRRTVAAVEITGPGARPLQDSAVGM